MKVTGTAKAGWNTGRELLQVAARGAFQLLEKRADREIESNDFLCYFCFTIPPVAPGLCAKLDSQIGWRVRALPFVRSWSENEQRRRPRIGLF